MKEIKHTFNNFDFLRFTAASLVIISHSVPLTGNGTSYIGNFTKFQTDLGGICVEIFFIISGYLICSSYLRVNNIFKYCLLRIIRIIPALVTVILITIFMIGPLASNTSTHEYFTSVLTYDYLKCILLYPMQFHLTGFNNHSPTIFNTTVNGSLWTLSIEFTCYLTIAVLGLTKSLNKYTVLFISIVCLLLSNNFTTMFQPSQSTYIHLKIWVVSQYCNLPLKELIRLMTYFFAGSFFFFMKNTIVYNWQWFMFCLLIILTACKIGHNLNIIAPIFGAYLVFYIAFNNKIKLQNFGKYGDFSYGIYIYGFLIQQLVIMAYGGKMSNTLNYLISLPIAIFMGYLSYHFIEKRFSKLKNIFK